MLAKTIASLGEKAQKSFPAGEDIPAGTYKVDETVRVNAIVVKSPASEPDAPFSFNEFVRDALLMYASQIDDGARWLRWLLDADGVYLSRLHHDIRKDNLSKYTTPEIVATWEELEAAAKNTVRMGKTKRAGATAVQGTLELVTEE